MLSHPANQEPEEATVATATSLLRQTQGNRRRHSEEVGNDFFRNWFINGPKLLMKGKFSRRAAVFMGFAAIPAIAVALFLTLPAILFPTPQHNQFFHFAKTINGDAATLIPVGIGILSSIFCLRLPLGP
jgi:hypothetical protein